MIGPTRSSKFFGWCEVSPFLLSGPGSLLLLLFLLGLKTFDIGPQLGVLLLCRRLLKVAVAETADDGLRSNRLSTVRASLQALHRLSFLNRVLVCFEQERHGECDNKYECAIDPPHKEAVAFGFCDEGRDQADNDGYQ